MTKRFQFLVCGFALLTGSASLALVSPVQPGHLKKRVSFDETYERYPAPYDLFFHLERILPYFDREYMSESCTTLNQENTTVLGGNLPNFGAPLEQEPGALFTELYVKCFSELFKKRLSRWLTEIAKKNLQHLVGSDVEQEIAKIPEYRSAVAEIKYSLLKPDLRARALSNLVETVVGPDPLLYDRQIIGAESVFGPEVRDKQSLLRLLERKAFERNSNPTLVDVLRDSTILLRIGPTLLKH